MTVELRRLWRGELAFSRAFWGYCIVFGLPLNVACSALALAAYASWNSTALFLAIHLLPIPYNVFSCIGAWRSTLKWKTSATTAELARGTIAILFLALLVV